jgi:hypothetical protein
MTELRFKNAKYFAFVDKKKSPLSWEMYCSETTYSNFFYHEEYNNCFVTFLSRRDLINLLNPLGVLAFNKDYEILGEVRDSNDLCKIAYICNTYLNINRADNKWDLLNTFFGKIAMPLSDYCYIKVIDIPDSASLIHQVLSDYANYHDKMIIPEIKEEIIKHEYIEYDIPKNVKSYDFWHSRITGYRINDEYSIIDNSIIDKSGEIEVIEESIP